MTRTLLAAATLLAGVSLTATAQARPMTPEDVAQLESLGAVAVSPDGSRVAYTTSSLPNVIEGDYRAEGYLKLPWNPRVPPYEGHIVWTIQPDDGSERAGLIVEQRQTWNISSAEALRETFTPSR